MARTGVGIPRPPRSTRGADRCSTGLRVAPNLVAAGSAVQRGFNACALILDSGGALRREIIRPAHAFPSSTLAHSSQALGRGGELLLLARGVRLAPRRQARPRRLPATSERLARHRS